MENEKYYDMLKKKINKRQEVASLYYSKIEIKMKLEKEIRELLCKIEDLDRKITILTPHFKTQAKS